MAACTCTHDRFPGRRALDFRMSDVERYVPGMQGPIWYEHWHRYHFAAPLVAGKSVIDAACGEGYGAALLARRARQVTAIDTSAETLALARRRYAAQANVAFVEGRCEALQLPAASVEAMVSFETLEHFEAPHALISEAARVLVPDGFFIVSTPD